MLKKINLHNSLCKVALIVLLLIFNSGCEKKKDLLKIPPTKNTQHLELTITTVNSVTEMRMKVWRYEEGIQGQTLYSPNDNKCEIIIYKPKRVDDEATLTLGHELMHCLYGDYHD